MGKHNRRWTACQTSKYDYTNEWKKERAKRDETELNRVIHDKVEKNYKEIEPRI
jgi:hypothetical protein